MQSRVLFGGKKKKSICIESKLRHVASELPDVEADRAGERGASDALPLSPRLVWGRRDRGEEGGGGHRGAISQHRSLFDQGIRRYHSFDVASRNEVTSRGDAIIASLLI